MSEGNKVNRIEDFKKGLYSRNSVFFNKRSRLLRKIYDVKTNWGEEDKKQEQEQKKEQEQEDFMKKRPKKNKSILNKIFLFAVVFFLFSTTAVFVNIFWGSKSVSTDNVEISIIAPSSIESGGELSLQITIKNNNPTDLELADLIIKYPTGAKSIGNKQKDLNTHRESLNTIKVGESVRKEIKAILYGEENSEKDIIVSLEYRIAGSNAIFFKDRKYQIKISSSPINLIVGPIEEVVSGQEINLPISVLSNVKSKIEDLLLVAEYPFGFEFISANPEPKYGNNVWEIDGEESTIKIKGIISGQDQEERVFKFSSGTRDNKDEKDIGAIFAFIQKSLIIKKPFLGVELALNGDSSDEYISSGKKEVRADVTWSNNSPTKIVDGVIKVKLSGGILDKSSISVDKGFYRSFDNTIIWDKNTSGELSEIGIDDKGRFSFSFSPVFTSLRNSFANPEIFIDISVRGTRFSEDGITEEINSSISKVVKFSSDLNIIPRATYFTGPFVNSGQLPPKVDEETTYTITWSITNIFNDVDGVKVASSLPSYIRWMGVVSPNSESISYNPIGGEIIWDVGEVKAGVGMNKALREVSFQVAFLPSLGQVGNTPNLTGDVSVEGIDKFTGEKLRSVKSGVTTRLSTDPGFGFGKGVVVE